jgi:DNA-binding MarR family transcriptional regulator
MVATMRQSVRDGIIATVVGGLILALVLAFWSAARHIVVRAAEATWSVLWRTVGVPLWVVLALGLFAAVLTARWAAARANAPPLTRRSGLPSAGQLSEQHWAILSILIRADGQPHSVEDLRGELGISQLRLEALLDELGALGIVAPQHHTVFGAHVILTRRGRDFLIRAGVA